MNRNRSLRIALVAAALAGGLPAPVRAQAVGASEYQGAAALGLALRRLGTTKRVLMIGAHPDDEDTQLLSALALEQGADVAYLSLTRGEGGQNGIGPELREALGILRTEELLAARRVDGAQQFFSRAFDFGFSKNADEAMRHWPREQVLGDVVETIRRFRPDVVVAVFSGTPRDGHGQHQVSAILAREAFAAAGDPTRYPEQLRAGLRPFRPLKYYQSLRGRAEGATVRLPIGDLDPLLGRSPFQLAMASRSRHRSQDMGQPEPAGPRWGYLLRVSPAAAGPAGGDGSGLSEPSIFTGIDSTLSARGIADAGRRARLAPLFADYLARTQRLRAEANPLAPERLVPELAATLALLDRADAALAGDTGADADELRLRIAGEREDARTALARAANVVLDVTVDRGRVVPGEEFGVEVSLWNGGSRPLAVRALAPSLPAGWEATPLDSLPAAPLAANSMLTRRFRVRVPTDAPVTEPYFLRGERQGDLYRWPDDPAVHGLPFEPGRIRGTARVGVEGADLPLEREAAFREVDQRQGELRRPVQVVPAVSVLLDPATRVLPVAAAGAVPAPLRYRVHLEGAAARGVAGTLRLVLPAGWRAEPASVPLSFAAAGERREAEFAVQPPAGVAAGDYPVRAVFEAQDGRRFERGVQMIDYPHVRARPLYHNAASTVRAFDLRVPQGLRVAYVTGAGEEGPGVLEQVGIQPELLDAQALASGDLGRFDVIVVGSRAYEVRPDLRAYNARLLEWVQRGGTLVVQYYKLDQVEGQFGPYPFAVGRPQDRVTDESSPVRIVEPASRALSWPNRITEADFAGWVQDRGLYFAHSWDPHYTAPLETADPGEAPLRGGLLVAPYGRGTYVYTGLAFFRQLPE
ncbi:MAG: PIG-L family deacetylase, partial [Gemmatimonadetes bacterium]|nr:PIG-L family deacetylase [Gemmatimonadota bacterium]